MNDIIARALAIKAQNALNTKADLVDGKIPLGQLPDSFDDVREYESFEELPKEGSKGLLYVTIDNNNVYRWSGSQYIAVSRGHEAPTKLSQLENDTKFVSEDWIDEKEKKSIKYEIFCDSEETLVDYREKEIRILCKENYKLQQGGANANPNMYYIKMRAYAPEGTVFFREDDAETITDTTIYSFENNSFAGIDGYGRHYSECWMAVAMTTDGGKSWIYFGNNSSIDHYIGVTYSFEWLDKDHKVISSDRIRVNLSNEKCHNTIEDYYAHELINTKLNKEKEETQKLIEKSAEETREWVKDLRNSDVKYELFYKSPNSLIDYREKEIRFLSNEKYELQNGANPNMYYIRMRAYAPDGAKFFREDDQDIIADQTIYTFENNSFAGIDEKGRKYSECWMALAMTTDGGKTWKYFGDNSTADHYVGVTYSFEWLDENKQPISSDRIRVNLTNSNCHNIIEDYYIKEYYASKADSLSKLEYQLNETFEEAYTSVPLGGVAANTALKGKTVREVLEMLLGIQKEPVPSTFIDYIMTYEIPAFVGSLNRGQIEVPFTKLDMESSLYAADGFYVSNDGTKVGYQLTFVGNNEMDAQKFAIPSNLKIVKAYQYDEFGTRTWLENDFPGSYWMKGQNETKFIDGRSIDYQTYIYNVENVGDAISVTEHWRFEVEVIN